MIKASELAEREIINITDGSRLGTVSDLQIDQLTGQISALVLDGRRRFFNLLGSRQKRIVPWSDIQILGIDAVLVEINQPGQERRVNSKLKSKNETFYHNGLNGNDNLEYNL